MAKNNTPLEIKEQAEVVRWCKEEGIEPYATAQDTYIGRRCYKCGHVEGGWNQINKNKALGVQKGVPDLIILIPKHRSTTGKTQLIFIEMKRQKGGIVSKEQKHFIELADSVHGDTHATVCRGAKQAKKYLSPLIAKQEPVPKDQLENFINSL